MPADRTPLAFALAALASAALLAAAAAPGWLGPEAGSAVRSAFSALCHQLPHRTPHVGGGAWALCHRCTGVAAGLAAGVLLAPMLTRSAAARLRAAPPARTVALSLTPLALDWALGAAGVWANTPLSRVATGALFGVAAGMVLGLALLPRRGAPHPSPNLLSA